MKHSELKPCPFCGNTIILLYCRDPYDGHHGDFAMWHAKCGVCTATVTRNIKSEAILAWNRRVNDGTK